MTWNPATDKRDAIRYVDVSAVSRETLEIELPTSISARDAPSRARKIVRANDTIFATIRPKLRRVAKVPPELDNEIASTAFCVLRPDTTQVDPDYLFLLVSSDAFITSVAEHETGASYPAVRDRDVLDQEVDLPSLPEQKSIAKVLNALRRSVLKEFELVRLTEELKHECMNRLFNFGLRGEPRKETEIGLVPETWTVGPMEQLGQFQRGFDITKSTQIEGHIPVVSSGGIRSYHNQAAAKGPGVVIGRKGSIGQLHYLESAFWPHDTTLWCTDFKGNIPRFVFYRLQTIDMKKLDSGATNPALNRNFLHAELISWPDLREQQEIAAMLTTIDAKIALHHQKCAVLEELFKSLLHKLTASEISVDDLDLSALELAPIEASV